MFHTAESFRDISEVSQKTLRRLKNF